jgi:type I restriction enzyme S subunit
MPNNWKTYKLGEIVDVKQGLAINKKTDHLLTEKSSMPLFKIRDLINNTVEHYVKEDEVPKQCIANYEDLIYSRTGQVGLVFRGKIGCIHNNCFKIIPNESIINKDLLFWFLKQPEIIEYANNIASGSVQKDLNHTAFKSIEISISDNINEQKNIAEIFNNINEKIENNLAINKTLEEMAMALYKHWFVDFGPFQDGEFVESELGRIPKGWEVKRLENFVEVLSKGTTPRMKDVEGLERKIPFLKVKDIKSDGEININGLELIPEETHLKDLKRSILFENDLLFSIAGTIGRVSIVTEKLNNSNCNQALAFIRLKEREKFKAIIYYWLKSDDVQNKIQNSIVQGVQANVSLTVLKELELIEPSNEILIDFANKVNPILELVLKNQKENQTLTQLRDTLLPKLISGEVRLKEFQES